MISMSIFTLTISMAIAAAAAEPPAKQGEAVPPATAPASPPAQDLRAGGDEHKRYFLIGVDDLSKPPANGFRLLLVLPGGDGSAEFHPFVTNIHKNALPEEFLIAQLVAPQWSKDQAKHNVWPIKSSQQVDAKFFTEEFIEAVINDVTSKCKIDPRFIFTLAWSSSGPAAYAASLSEKSQITGSFVAMSVFKPNDLPDLANAKGKAFYILHSPQDFIAMRFPEAARDQLAANGAITKLTTYEGGHGWKGDVVATIRTGIEWLQKQQE